MDKRSEFMFSNGIARLSTEMLWQGCAKRCKVKFSNGEVWYGKVWLGRAMAWQGKDWSGYGNAKQGIEMLWRSKVKWGSAKA